MSDILSLLLGIACAGLGGELFVRGVVGVAHWARIPPGIIGATIAAFATSSPELSVSVNAALAGEPQIGLGDALGSNVVNIALILGSTLVISGIRSPRDSLKRDFPVAVIIPILTFVIVLDGELSRLDGLLLLGLFAAWLAATAVSAHKQRSAAEAVLGEYRHGRAVLFGAGGLALLIAAGALVVRGAKGLALSLGVDEFLIGATIVAIGTSAPELATALIAKLRGHDEVGLGTLIGSNLFNGLLIVGSVSAIHPFHLAWDEVAVALVIGILALALSYPRPDGLIERRRGVFLLVLYLVYLALIIQRGAA